jgi:hypothetical protein
MKKELFTAIVIGAIFGFIITASFWAIREGKIKSITQPEPKAKKSSPDNSQDQSDNSQNQPQDETLVHLEIDSPTNESIVNQAQLEISGQTEAFSTIVILHQNGDEILTADQNGSFKETIEVNGGLNIIKITSFDQDGNFAEKILHITYSTVKI